MKREMYAAIGSSDFFCVSTEEKCLTRNLVEGWGIRLKAKNACNFFIQINKHFIQWTFYNGTVTYTVEKFELNLTFYVFTQIFVNLTQDKYIKK